MPTAEGFEEFVSIIDCGSVTGAAEALGLPRPTLSRRLARLEERLGVRLLHRTTRKLKMTRPGELLYAKARRIVLAAREAEAEVRRLDGVPRGILRVSTPTCVARAVMAQWIVEFLVAYPEVRVELVASNVHVQLAAEGFDVALRGGAIDDPSLVVRVLAHDERIAVASPAYLAEHGIPERAEELTGHNCIVGYKHGRSPELRWPLRDGGWTPVSGTLTADEMGVRIEAAKRHLGITMVVDRFVAKELASGELMAVLSDSVGCREPLSLVYPDPEFLDPKVRAFIDYFVARIEEVWAVGGVAGDCETVAAQKR